MKLLIIEDEPLIARRLARAVSEHFGARLSGIEYSDELDNALELIQHTAFDLVLLDLNLFGQNGFDILQHTNAASFHTIIVSAYAEQAIRAFEFGVLDFVAKPFSQERLTKALQRFDNSQSLDHSHTEKSHLKKNSRTEHQPNTHTLVVKKLGQLQLLAIKDIDYIRADGHYSQLWMNDGSTHFHDKPIERLLTILPAHFVRSHRSYAVNIQHVVRVHIEPGGKYFIDTHFSKTIPLARSLYSTFKECLTPNGRQ